MGGVAPSAGMGGGPPTPSTSIGMGSDWARPARRPLGLCGSDTDACRLLLPLFAAEKRRTTLRRKGNSSQTAAKKRTRTLLVHEALEVEQVTALIDLVELQAHSRLKMRAEFSGREERTRNDQFMVRYLAAVGGTLLSNDHVVRIEDFPLEVELLHRAEHFVHDVFGPTLRPYPCSQQLSTNSITVS